jgi:hypothetical protein
MARNGCKMAIYESKIFSVFNVVGKNMTRNDVK